MTAVRRQEAGRFHNAAYGLAFAGFHVFPVSPLSKRPSIRGWRKLASADTEQVGGWAGQFPHAMVGLPTGAANGFFVVDLDEDADKNVSGSASLRELEGKYGKLPTTYAVRTGSGGRHLYFRMPRGTRIPNRARQFADGIDVRGDGGFVVAAGSIRSDGKTYNALGGEPLGSFTDEPAAIAEAPDWVLFHAIFNRRQRELLSARGIQCGADFGDIPPSQWAQRQRELSGLASKQSVTPGEVSEARKAGLLKYVRSSVEAECETIRDAAAGERDDTLYRSLGACMALLRGAENEGVSLPEIESDVFLALVTAAETHGAEFNEDVCRDKWERLAETSEPRDLSNVGLEAKGKASAEQEFADVLGNSATGKPRLVSQRCADVQMKCIAWHWPQRLPRGMCSLLAGHGGLGKSTVLLDIAARTTLGARWPDSSAAAKAGSVIYFATEDPAEQVLKPRFVAAGGDPNKLHFATSVLSEDGRRTFNLKNDLALLEELMTEIGDVRLLIFDPISAYFGQADTWRNTEVRAALEPIGEMAARRDLTVIGNTHLTKGSKGAANARVLDSVAMTAVARSVYMVIEDADEPNRRLFIPSKNNLGRQVEGLSFTIDAKTVDTQFGIEGSYVIWGDRVTATADEALAAVDDKGRKPSKVAAAADWLSFFLAEGAKPVAELMAAGLASNHSQRTLERAKEKLGIRPRKIGPGEGWIWELPQSG